MKTSILRQRLRVMCEQKLFEKKQLAVSNWQLAKKGPGIGFMVFGTWQSFATLCRLGLGLGLGHPWVTQGPPKRHARATQGSIDGSAFVFNKNWKKAGGVDEIG